MSADLFLYHLSVGFWQHSPVHLTTLHCEMSAVVGVAAVIGAWVVDVLVGRVTRVYGFGDLVCCYKSMDDAQIECFITAVSNGACWYSNSDRCLLVQQWPLWCVGA